MLWSVHVLWNAHCELHAGEQVQIHAECVDPNSAQPCCWGSKGSQEYKSMSSAAAHNMVMMLHSPWASNIGKVT